MNVHEWTIILPAHLEGQILFIACSFRFFESFSNFLPIRKSSVALTRPNDRERGEEERNRSADRVKTNKRTDRQRQTNRQTNGKADKQTEK